MSMEQPLSKFDIGVIFCLLAIIVLGVIAVLSTRSLQQKVPELTPPTQPMLTLTNSNVFAEQHKFLTVSNLPFVIVGSTMLYKFDDATWNAITQHYAGASTTTVDFYEAISNKVSK